MDITAAGTPGSGPRIRSVLSEVPSYVPGRPAAGFTGEAYKISSNENPYPPLPGVLEVVARSAAELNRYPDMAASALVEAVGVALKLPASAVVPGTGSVGALIQLLQAVVDQGDEVVFAWRSFEAYPIVVRLAGGVPVPVPLAAGGRHDLAAMAAAVTPRTKAVLVCTPNNPTGPAVRQAELEEFLATVPRDVLVVIDEAYVEFVRDPEAADGLGIFGQHPNVAVLRTFSKAYGLAGLRVGFAVAHDELAVALRKTAVPFGVSGIAQAAAVASLASSEQLQERVEALVAERARVVGELRGQGWDLPDAQGNFVWLPLAERTGDFVAACDRSGLAVRGFSGDGARCTVGETPANDRLIGIAKGFVPPNG